MRFQGKSVIVVDGDGSLDDYFKDLEGDETQDLFPDGDDG